jgi:hypothetical protein
MEKKEKRWARAYLCTFCASGVMSAPEDRFSWRAKLRVKNDDSLAGVVREPTSRDGDVATTRSKNPTDTDIILPTESGHDCEYHLTFSESHQLKAGRETRSLPNGGLK